LIAYIGNISAKKCQNPFVCFKVIASQRWDVFETRRTVDETENLPMLVPGTLGMPIRVVKIMKRKVIFAVDNGGRGFGSDGYQ